MLDPEQVSINKVKLKNATAIWMVSNFIAYITETKCMKENPDKMRGGKLVSLHFIILVCFSLFPPPCSLVAGIDLLECHRMNHLYKSSFGDMLNAHAVDNHRLIAKESCLKLKRLDELCVPNWWWAKKVSPYRPKWVKKRCSEFGPDY